MTQSFKKSSSLNLPVSVQFILKSHPDKGTEQLLSLTASLQSLQKPLCLHPSVPAHLSLQMLTLLPPSAMSWKALSIDSSSSRNLKILKLLQQLMLPQHSAGIMPDLAKMLPNAKKTLLYVRKRFPRPLMVTSGSGNNSHLFFHH